MQMIEPSLELPGGLQYWLILGGFCVVLSLVVWIPIAFCKIGYRKIFKRREEKVKSKGVICQDTTPTSSNFLLFKP